MLSCKTGVHMTDLGCNIKKVTEFYKSCKSRQLPPHQKPPVGLLVLALVA